MEDPQGSSRQLITACRLCLAQDRDLYPILRYTDASETMETPLSQKIMECVSVMVSTEDVLPKVICQSCLEKVFSWYHFRDNCSRTQDILKQWLNCSMPFSTVTKNIQIKEEPPSFEDSCPMEVATSTKLPNTSMLNVKEEMPDSLDYYDMHSNSLSENDPLRVRMVENNIGSLLRLRRRDPAGAVPQVNDFVDKAARLHHKRALTKDVPQEHSRDNVFYNIGEENDANFSRGELSQADKCSRLRTRSLGRVEASDDPASETIKHDPSWPGRLIESPDMEEAALEPDESRIGDSKRRNWTCRNCGESYKDKNLFLEHVESHGLECSLCKKVLSHKSCLYRHLRTHGSTIKCQRCSQRFPSVVIYNQHLEECSASIYKIICTETNKSKTTSDDFVANQMGNELPSVSPAIYKPFTDKLIIKRAILSNVVSDEPISIPSTSSNVIPKMEMENGDNVFSCYICHEVFPDHNKLVHHRRKHKVYNCPHCHKVFTKGIALSNHIRKHDVNYGCPMCPRNFKSKNLLYFHLKRIHKKNIGDLTSVNKEKEVVEIKNKPVFRSVAKPKKVVSNMIKYLNSGTQLNSNSCHLCERTFVNIQTLKKHAMTHTDMKLFSCNMCEVSVKYCCSLEKHMKSNHKLDCSLKKGLFKSIIKNGVKIEEEAMLKMEGVDNNMCNICQEHFTEKQHLWSHLKVIHMGFKAFKCGLCSKTFSTPKLLSKHVKLHFESRNFSCQVCGENFTNLESFYVHKQEHIGVENHKCEICSEIFRSLKSLKMHKLKRHLIRNSYLCQFCFKPFPSKCELDNHEKMHVKLKIFLCGICKESHNSMSALNRHRQECHKEEEELESTKGVEPENYNCDVCSDSLKSSAALRRHKQSHYEYLSVNNPNNVKQENDVNEAKSCGICQQICLDVSTFEEHLSWHVDLLFGEQESMNVTSNLTLEATCPHCQEVYGTKEALTDHLRLLPSDIKINNLGFSKQKKKGSPSKVASNFLSRYCKLCNKRFNSWKRLSIHRGWHSRKEKALECNTTDIKQEPNKLPQETKRKRVMFACNVCKKLFSTVTILSKHKQLHVKRYTTSSYDGEVGKEPRPAIKTHKTIHQPAIEYPARTPGANNMYKCTYCHKHFISAKSVYEHEGIHTGNRPYRCNQCPKAFLRETNLCKHKRLHTPKGLGCPNCHMKFHFRYEVRTHMTKTHLNPHKCKKCDKFFDSDFKLYTHVKNVH